MESHAQLSPFLIAFNKESEQHNSILRDLHGSGIDVKLSIPKVIISGDRHSGKSSILEHLLGIPLTGVRQCEIEMIKSKRIGEFNATVEIELKGFCKRQFSAKSWNEMLNGIEIFCSDTIKDNQVVESVVRIKIQADNVPNLHICEEQDQNQKWTRHSNTTQLAVIDSTCADARNSIASINKAHDFHGSGTIGVLTKTDLLDSSKRCGFGLMEIAGRVPRPLQLGYVAVGLGKNGLHLHSNGEDSKEYVESNGVEELMDRVVEVVGSKMHKELILQLSQPSILEKCRNQLKGRALDKLTSYLRSTSKWKSSLLSSAEKLYDTISGISAGKQTTPAEPSSTEQPARKAFRTQMKESVQSAKQKVRQFTKVTKFGTKSNC